MGKVRKQAVTDHITVIKGPLLIEKAGPVHFNLIFQSYISHRMESGDDTKITKLVDLKQI